MEQTLKYIQEKFKVDLNQQSPIRLPIDKYREFPKLLKELGFKVGAEIGVCKGMYSKWLCHQIKGLKLFLVDPYKSYKEYSEYLDQNEMNNIEAEAKVRLAKYNVEFVKKMSMDAVKDFNDNSLDFVYIDGNHAFEYVVNDITEWSKKVKPGGIVSGHDYSDYMREVRIGVDAWTEVKRIKPWFITRHRNWFYVKGSEVEPKRDGTKQV